MDQACLIQNQTGPDIKKASHVTITCDAFFMSEVSPLSFGEFAVSYAVRGVDAAVTLLLELFIFGV